MFHQDVMADVKGYGKPVTKRSMAPGFAGIDNDLYYMDKTMMLFGDARAMVTQLIEALSHQPASL
jgi:NAD/NADP transhydrogenase beta subunit